MAKRQFTMYSVWYLTKENPRSPTRAPNGPWDYYRNALDHRNAFFKTHPKVTRCWIIRSRDDQEMGAVLVR